MCNSTWVIGGVSDMLASNGNVSESILGISAQRQIENNLPRPDTGTLKGAASDATCLSQNVAKLLTYTAC